MLVSAYAHSGLYESEFAISTLDESLYFATMTGDVYHVTPEGPQLVYNGYVSLDDLSTAPGPPGSAWTSRGCCCCRTRRPGRCWPWKTGG